ncbi:MAG: UpxY family transcription antiterminator [Acidobacteria bacterium]|nr:UpxY family transcription antiterminator [Acidobacteriota bacterium]
MPDRLAWYALTTKPQHERKAVQALNIQGFQTFLPFYKSRRQWSDRAKTLELPLFPGYVFCRFTLEQRLRVLASSYILSVICVGRQPQPVADQEIESIRTMVASGMRVEPWEFLEVGQRVRIQGGSLDGLSGLLVQEKDALRVVVSVNLLRRSVAVEIARERLVVETNERRVA